MNKMHRALCGAAVLACTAALTGLSPAKAQLASFTRAYQDRLTPSPFPLDYNNTNMITVPYYGGVSSPKGYLVANNVDDDNGHLIVRLTAVAPDGSASWSRTYGKFGENVRCFAVTPDKRDLGYLLTGYRYNPATGRDDLWLLKVDREGNARREFSFNTDSIPCTKQGNPLLPCQTLHAPHFYGMDILQIEDDTAAKTKGEFAVVGFVSEKSSEEEYHTLKRNFVWRFRMSTLDDTLSRPNPGTVYLKVFHGLGIGNNEPTDQELANEIQEIPGFGLMILGHTKGIQSPGPVPTPYDGVMYPYYTLLNYNGGGSSSIISSVVFSHAWETLNTDQKNVRTLYGKDGYVYMLGYYQPTQAFTLTVLKPSGSQGNTNRYYTDQTENVPAFSMYQSKSNSDELMIMGYRLGYDYSVQQDFMHPYTIMVKKDGTPLTKFNIEQIRSNQYNGYSPSDPISGQDYFKPMEKYFPPATLPEIGQMNYHLGYEDAQVAGVLHRKLPGGSQEHFHATLSQFTVVEKEAECHPLTVPVYVKELPLDYDKISWNINLIRFKTTVYTTNERKTGPYYKCDEIPEAKDFAATQGRRNGLNNEEQAVRLFPNPATDMLQVQGVAGESYSYSITTVTGVLVGSGSFEQQTSIALGDWANGVYLITLDSRNGVQHRYRFIKQ